MPAGSGIFGSCPCSGIQWALELFVWNAERLVRVTSIPSKLCVWKIDDNWANKPMASIESIFCIWMAHTAASLDQRNWELETLSGKFPDVGWQVCVDQLKPGPTLGQPLPAVNCLARVIARCHPGRTNSSSFFAASIDTLTSKKRNDAPVFYRAGNASGPASFNPPRHGAATMPPGCSRKTRQGWRPPP